MRLILVCFTSRGAALCKRLSAALEKDGASCRSYTTEKLAAAWGLSSFGPSLSAWIKTVFSKEQTDGFLFVGACGIAVRAIAPWLRDKTVDPAVVVVDEQAHFAVSLLSGHVGNANTLAQQVAACIGATPVISTATDLNGLFAIDSWAAHHGLTLSDRTLAKQVSACLLEGTPVGFASDFPLPSTDLPQGFTTKSTPDLGIWISASTQTPPFPHTLQCIPKTVCLGIGCRRDTALDTLIEAIQTVLEEYHLSFHAVKSVATISFKEKEPALLAFTHQNNLPLQIFSAEELGRAKGSFTPSTFVKRTVGVDNVCERAAVLGSGNGTLRIKKQARNGVTVAAAIEDWSVDFGY